MEITQGIIQKPLRVVIYGPEGIGKTTFASQFPAPVFIDTENSTEFLDVSRFPKPTSWTMLLQEIAEAKRMASAKSQVSSPEGGGNGNFRTLALDTADWAEALCKAHVCAKANVSGIEDFGYGRGYVYLAEEWGRMLNALTELRDVGMNVVVTAHAFLQKFEQPDEMGSYDRWSLKLEKKVAPLLKEWADMILFANYETFVVKEKEKSAKGKAQGGRRVMYTSHHPCWDAKNRQGLPDKLPFEFAQIEHCIPVRAGVGSQMETVKPDNDLPFTMNEMETTEKPSEPTQEPPVMPEASEGVPKALADLMKEYDVTETQIQQAVASRGYYPADTPIKNYDPNFVAGVLVGAWDQVHNMIKENTK